MRILLYIDPGSGSYLVQVIIAAILGGFFYFKNIWRKFISFFTGRKKNAPPESPSSGKEPPGPFYPNDHENP